LRTPWPACGSPCSGLFRAELSVRIEEYRLSIDFEKIAPYLKDPLILIGFFLFLAFLFARAIIKAGIIPQLSRIGGYRVLQRILLYGFLIALLLIGLGFGLKYRELSRGEQTSAVHLLQQEFADNLAVLASLKSNTETMLTATDTVSQVLRTPGIKLLSALFPAENLDPHVNVPASVDYAQQLLQRADQAGLIANPLERQKFGLAAQAVTGTIERTASAVRSLADPDGQRYVVKSEVWQSQLPILRKVNIVNVTDFQAAYTQIQLTRANYNVVTGRCIDYLASVEHFLNPSDHKINPQSLAAVLAAERLYVVVASEYAEKLIESIKQTQALDSDMKVENP